MGLLVEGDVPRGHEDHSHRRLGNVRPVERAFAHRLSLMNHSTINGVLSTITFTHLTRRKSRLDVRGGQTGSARIVLRVWPVYPLQLLGLLLISLVCGASAAPFDAAPFALPLPEGNGLLWEDPREIHQVVVQFAGTVPPAGEVHLEYWGSRWPQQHLPKDREPGGGDVGWMELGNWHQGGWRTADTVVTADGSSLAFAFKPVNGKEFPALKGYSASFRYTLKLRVRCDHGTPSLQRLQAFTDSACEDRPARLAWKDATRVETQVEAFNGSVRSLREVSPREHQLLIQTTTNPDPNTFDRTLVSVRHGTNVFTFRMDDLAAGALFLPRFGVAVLPESDSRDYAEVAKDQESKHSQTLYDRVAKKPEQTWRDAWENLPPKKSHIVFPLGLDGGRQRFCLEADGSIHFRSNDHYLQARPGQDTGQLKLEAAPVRFRFGSLGQPVERHIEEESLPICYSTWETGRLRITQTAFVTELAGVRAEGPVPTPDTTAVFLGRFVFTNLSDAAETATLPLDYLSGEGAKALRLDDQGLLWIGPSLRGQVIASGAASGKNKLSWSLAPHEAKTAWVKIPYLVLTEPTEQTALKALDFEAERKAVAGYWRRRLDESTRLITPEPVLDRFFRADSSHLLINCEREPGDTVSRRFARVGSFSYGAYGNESCMMVVDLDRRGYHREAQECLDGWLHYQGTVGLPGDFSSKAGVLYGAGGYEAGGYNQHHGWILWCLAEHYRFTRDEAWLRHATPGILAGADWIIRESARTAGNHELERGLLPAGSLEDIGDWWTWLSTSCYTWRGLDSAAWALEQSRHPEAARVRQAANTFHASLLANFGKAAERSPVVRLRDGTAVPHIPSSVHRRGRSFGWICETLEGALHLLITGALDPQSAAATEILKDYEDNLYLSNQYGYLLPDFERDWFNRGGMSMQACLLLDVEPYLRRDDVKHALRAMFNAIAVSHFPDVHINTEHALPEMGDWRGDHYKSSDESNACGWLRQILVREEGEDLWLGQAVPREWLKPGQSCGIERAATYFGPASVLYRGGENEITAQVEGPRRNPPKGIRLRFRIPDERPIASVTVNGQTWKRFAGEWVELPGNIGAATVKVRWAQR